MLFLHVALVVFVGALVPATGAFTLRLLSGLSGRARAREARAEIERRGKEGGTVLSGVLRVQHPLPDGGGATTTWSSSKRLSQRALRLEQRAEGGGLAVETDGGRVALTGGVEVLAGSSVRMLGTRAPTTERRAFFLEHSVRDGDPIVVVGAPDGGGDYRGLGLRELGPLPGSSSVAIAMAGGGSSKRAGPARAYARHWVMAPLVLIGLLPLYGMVKDATFIDCSAACRNNGRCSIASRLSARESPRGVLPLLEGHHFTCVAEEDERCRASRACLESGLCSAVDGSCRASAGDDCLMTAGCVQYGTCTPVDGVCKAASVDDCRNLKTCSEDGRCAAKDGFCSADDDASCRASTGCHQYGLCSAKSGECVAALDADCASSEVCTLFDRCVASDGQCTSPAATDERCAASRQCAESRKCKAENGKCGFDAPTCETSLACKRWGRCGGTTSCRALDDKHCEAAEVCKGKQDCRRREDSCASSCRETDACRRAGRCTDAEGECVASSVADCQNSLDCATRGRCTPDGGTCILTSSADCARTYRCRNNLECTFEKGACVRTRADCERSLGCIERGECTPGDLTPRCSVGGDRDCRGSAVCKKRGWCKAVHLTFSIEDTCAPASLER